MTDAKSTPKTRANSLRVNERTAAGDNLRILGDDFRGVDHLHVNHHALEKVL
jgi:hypothetical protein